MARLARVVVPGLPHHVTQRGNRRQPVFFEPGDQDFYIDLLAERCRKARVAVWAWCLMPNHVHLVMTPETPDGLARAVGEVHRRYTAFVNARMRLTGHLFQSRFSSVAMDEDHSGRGGALCVAQSGAGKTGSASAGLGMVERARPLGRPRRPAGACRAGARPRPRHAGLFETAPDCAGFDGLRRAETTGRPLGGAPFLARIETLLKRPVAPRKPGRKPKGGSAS